MWRDEDLVTISAIEHYSYCRRQCALIHVEQVFDENVFTLRGTRAHERADTTTFEERNGVRIERGLTLWSDRLGLTGRADVVEFHATGAVVPVEYKHGPRRQNVHDDLQLCAQALCLEEMLGIPVIEGAIYHHSTRRRRSVVISDELRAEMETVVAAIRELVATGRMPPPVNDARCPNCSLADACVPAVVEAARLTFHSRALYRVDDMPEEEFEWP